MDLIAAVLNNCQDENNFINEAKLELFEMLEIIYFYTNISFTDKQKEDPAKLFDLFNSSGLLDKIIESIPEEEYFTLNSYVYETANNIYNYRNSIYGILDAVGTDYQNLELDAEKIKQDIANPENLKVVKDVLTKLG